MCSVSLVIGNRQATRLLVFSSGRVPVVDVELMGGALVEMNVQRKFEYSDSPFRVVDCCGVVGLLCSG